MNLDGTLKSEKELKILDYPNKRFNAQIKFEPLNVIQ